MIKPHDPRAAASAAASTPPKPAPKPGPVPGHVHKPARPAAGQAPRPGEGRGPGQAQGQKQAQRQGQKQDPERDQERNREQGQAEREAPAEPSPEVLTYPFIALTIQSTGIHPSTGRLLTIDAVTFNEAGEHGEEFYVVLDPDGDPGPFHLHGLTEEELAAAGPFSRQLKTLDRLIDGRTLILHETSVSWGFLVSEARRAMTNAARQNRARNRGKTRGRRRRQKVGHVPTPLTIVDTLATARRQAVQLTDLRLGAVARASGVDCPPPTATVERAAEPAAQTCREQTLLLIELARHQRGRGPVGTFDPNDLRADRAGLQRTNLRVDAAMAPRMHHNPGPYKPGKELVRGMEIVVAPDIEMDPDTIIEAITREELNYSEKLTRETSLVVCNVTTDLVGKPMHAARKDIPLMSDVAFLQAIERIQEPGEPPKEEERSGRHVPNSNNRSSGRGRRSRGGKRRGGQNRGGQAQRGQSRSGQSQRGQRTQGGNAAAQGGRKNNSRRRNRRNSNRNGRGNSDS